MKPASLGTAAIFLACCLLLPGSARATNDVNFDNGSTLSGTTAGLRLSGFTLVSVVGINDRGLMPGDLGSVPFSRASLASGLPLPNGVLFAGTFSRPVSWTLITLAAGTHHYPVTGVVVGTTLGHFVNAVFFHTALHTGMGSIQDSTLIAGGETRTVSSVPEPSTLILLLSGSVCTFGMARRKLLAR